MFYQEITLELYCNLEDVKKNPKKLNSTTQKQLFIFSVSQIAHKKKVKEKMTLSYTWYIVCILYSLTKTIHSNKQRHIVVETVEIPSLY